ncbi:hypothetical protein IQ227_02015 [Anabaena aphanizomenioides LEGE 00250]|uniref:Uncharacterized protein n=2 Tax=Aphanizomenonaceae TaxID=1892259 RepID=A0ABR9V8M5_9CYAN|nr:hypothetical protein [Sphaerospermopsis aphanizomenoides LEGE 00250]
MITQSPVTSHQSPVTSHQSPVTSHQSPVTSHQSPVTFLISQHTTVNIFLVLHLIHNWYQLNIVLVL